MVSLIPLGSASAHAHGPGNKFWKGNRAHVKSIITRVTGPGATEIVLLPPAGSRVPQQFQRVLSSVKAYRSVLSQIQSFRGRIYLEDKAITHDELTPDGRHVLPIDERSWHVMAVEDNGELSGCARFLEESTATRFDDLWLRGAAVAHCPSIGAGVRRAVENEMGRARKERVRFGEVGGWAISNQRRCGTEALRLVLSTFGLLQLLGGCIGLATATVRHGSAEILRKFGFASLCAAGSPVAPYYDPQYGCLMELLKFDSRSANSRFMAWIEEFTSNLTVASVVASGEPAQASRPWHSRPMVHVPGFANSAVA